MLGLGFLAAAGQLPSGNQRSEQQPVISGLRVAGTNLVVTVRVPTGLRKLTLETRPQLRAGAWAPRQVVRLEGLGGETDIPLPLSPQMQAVRIKAADREPLPAFFYQGSNVFAATLTTNLATRLDGPVVLYGNGTMDGPVATPSTSGGDGTTARDVVESDIWRLRDGLLYFYNQQRGLQLLDVRQPDQPVLVGAWEHPAQGEQMYVLDSGHAVLLSQAYCGGSEVTVVDAAARPLRAVASLDVPGTLLESRLVGSVLYTASSVSRSVVSGNGVSTWHSTTVVSAFDLAEPSLPVVRPTLEVPGYAGAVTATERFFLVVTPNAVNSWQSDVAAVDITDPAGTLGGVQTVTASGTVKDKFKLRVAGTVLSLVAEENRWTNGVRVLVTRLENFNLPDLRMAGPMGVAKLGEVELVRDEQVFGTRFDGSLAYVVTYRVVDPLWVVDLSDARKPRVVGELHVPGWSTYLQPLGDGRLVTVGFDDNRTNFVRRVAVQLFSVADPARPELLAKVPLGDGYSWSEATADEKAFTVLPGAGLILLPYQGYTTNGYASQVQIIDLGTNSLAARGVIAQAFQPRRATLFQDRILTLSGQQLLSVDATDRDRPQVRARLDLAWTVDQVFPVGEYLVQMEAGSSYWWGTPVPPSLRVTPATNTSLTLARLELKSGLPVVGATCRDGRLYLLQQPNSYGYPYRGGPVLLADTGTATGAGDGARMTVVDLAALPELRVASTCLLTNLSDTLGGRISALWPRPDLLVWYGQGNNYYSGWPYLGDSIFVTTALWWPYYYQTPARMVALAVGGAEPVLQSELVLGDLTRNNYSPAWVADGLVFLSHDLSESVFLEETKVSDETGPITRPACWQTRRQNILEVIDYTDAMQPTLRSPVELPGPLAGVAREGALLFTAGNWITTNGQYRQVVSACSYDDVKVALVDELRLPEGSLSPCFPDGAVVFAVPGLSNQPPRLERWEVAWETGRFTRAAAVNLPAPLTTLNDGPGFLLDRSPSGFTLRDSSTLGERGLLSFPACLGVTTDRVTFDPDRGAWVPFGSFGVRLVPLGR
jgi:hypothetical protein